VKTGNADFSWEAQRSQVKRCFGVFCEPSVAADVWGSAARVEIARCGHRYYLSSQVSVIKPCSTEFGLEIIWVMFRSTLGAFQNYISNWLEISKEVKQHEREVIRLS